MYDSEPVCVSGVRSLHKVVVKRAGHIPDEHYVLFLSLPLARWYTPPSAAKSQLSGVCTCLQWLAVQRALNSFCFQNHWKKEGWNILRSGAQIYHAEPESQSLLALIFFNLQVEGKLPRQTISSPCLLIRLMRSRSCGSLSPAPDNLAAMWVCVYARPWTFVCVFSGRESC